MIFAEREFKLNIMSKLLIILLMLTFSFAASSQNIRKIAAYDSESSYTSGVYCISDTAVYRYSWYYYEWFQIPGNGLTKIDDTTRISSIAVYNNKISNSSGLFVFSDTAVFNYNWYAQTWFPLSNTGLPRNAENKPDIYDLAVYGDSGSSSYSDPFALTHSGIYRYIWYYQEWYPLSNTGLQLSAGYGSKEIAQPEVYPNPVDANSVIEIELAENYTGTVEFTFFDTGGRFITKDVIANTGSVVRYVIPAEKLKTGLYYCEIKAGNVYKSVRFVKT